MIIELTIAMEHKEDLEILKKLWDFCESLDTPVIIKLRAVEIES